MGNKYATKSTRKIEIAWWHNDKNVRAHTGGGARKITVNNSAASKEVLAVAREYFFPGGRSARGIDANNCTFELRDHTHTQW